jgi:hypothetical protein
MTLKICGLLLCHNIPIKCEKKIVNTVKTSSVINEEWVREMGHTYFENIPPLISLEDDSESNDEDDCEDEIMEVKV